MSESRSRKTFRFMPAPVLSHNLASPEAARQAGASPLGAGSFGRGLYGRKVTRSDDGTGQGGGLRLSRAPRTLLRWQHPFRYLILWQRHDFTLTWHAPWCRRCDCPGAGWRFDLEGGYASGLGFELSYARG